MASVVDGSNQLRLPSAIPRATVSAGSGCGAAMAYFVASSILFTSHHYLPPLCFYSRILQANFSRKRVHLHAIGNEAPPPRPVLLDSCCLVRAACSSFLLRLDGVPGDGECPEFGASCLSSSLFVACVSCCCCEWGLILAEGTGFPSMSSVRAWLGS